MFIKSGFVRLISVICLSLALTVAVSADTIRLKNGSIIKGKIISFDKGTFVVLIDDGARQRSLTFSADQIESIVFDSPAVPVRTSADPRNDQPTDPNTRIITVGQTKPNTAPPVLSTGNDPKPAGGFIPPVRLEIKVLADNTANGWTNSGWVVKKGQKIRIRATRRISLGNGRMTDAGGIASLPDAGKLIKDKPTGSLIAVIGADNNEFIHIGESAEFTATRDGDLFLGINEGNLDDNSGSFDIIIEIDPNTGG